MVQAEAGRSTRRWRRLLKRQIAPILGVPLDQIVLQDNPPGRTASPKRYVRFLAAPGLPLMIAKAVEKPLYPLRRSHRLEKYRDAARKTLALERMNIPTPRLLGRGEYPTLSPSPTFHRPRGIHSRQTPDAGRPALLSPRHGAVGSLHDHTETGWGGLAWPVSSRRTDFPPVGWAAPSLSPQPDQPSHSRTVERDPDRPDLANVERRLLAGVRRPSISLSLVPRRYFGEEFRPARRPPLGHRPDRHGIWSLRPRSAARGVELTDRDSGKASDAWQTYFEAAEPSRWKEFRHQASFCLAFYYLDEVGPRPRLPEKNIPRLPPRRALSSRERKRSWTCPLRSGEARMTKFTGMRSSRPLYEPPPAPPSSRRRLDFQRWEDSLSDLRSPLSRGRIGVGG